MEHKCTANDSSYVVRFINGHWALTDIFANTNWNFGIHRCPYCGLKLEKPGVTVEVSREILKGPRLCYTCAEYHDCKRSEPSCWKPVPPVIIEMSRETLEDWMEIAGKLGHHLFALKIENVLKEAIND